MIDHDAQAGAPPNPGVLGVDVHSRLPRYVLERFRRLTWEEAVLGWVAPALFAVLIHSALKGLATGAVFWDFQGSLMSISAAVFFVALAQGRGLTLPKRIVVPFVVLAVSTWISILGSFGPTASLRRLYLYGSVLAFGIAIYLMHRDAKRIPLDRYCIAVGLAHVPFLAEIIYWIIYSDGPVLRTSAAIPNFSNVRHFGYLGFLAAACGSVLWPMNKKLSVTSFCLTATALFGIVLLGSRGAVASWLLLVALLIYLRPEKVRIAAHALLAFAVAGATVHFLYVNDILVTPNLFVRVVATATDAATVDGGRIALWLSSLPAIADRLLFGRGPEAFFLSGCCHPYYVQAHNFVLQFLLEFGVVGCVVICVLCGRLVETIGRRRDLMALCVASDQATALTCLIVSFLGFALIDGMLYYQVPLMHFALFCGLFFAAARIASRPTDPAEQIGTGA